MAIIAETTAQVLVSDTVTPPLPAEKIDEIVASVRDRNCLVIDNKVIFQGILHKQIFSAGTDGIVRHFDVDIPFSGFADTPGAPAGSACQLTPFIAFLDFNLISPAQIQETVVIDINITVFDTVSNAVMFTNALPVMPLRFGPPNTVSTRNL